MPRRPDDTTRQLDFAHLGTAVLQARIQKAGSAARQAAERRGVELETRLETGSLDRLPGAVRASYSDV